MDVWEEIPPHSARTGDLPHLVTTGVCKPWAHAPSQAFKRKLSPLHPASGQNRVRRWEVCPRKQRKNSVAERAARGRPKSPLCTAHYENYVVWWWGCLGCFLGERVAPAQPRWADCVVSFVILWPDFSELSLCFYTQPASARLFSVTIWVGGGFVIG